MIEVYWIYRWLSSKKDTEILITEHRLPFTDELKIFRTISNYAWCQIETFSVRKHMFLDIINSIY